MATATLSKAGQMRLKRAAGMSVGDIARLFNVTYHNAYAVVVTNAGRESRILAGSSSKPAGSLPSAPRLMSPEQLAGLPESFLLGSYESRGKSKAEKEDWRAVRDELDRRDPTGSWMDRAKSV